MTELECFSVSVSLGKLGKQRVLNDMSFHVPSGGWLTLLGRNGAGKTTMLKAISALVSFDGDIRLDGESLRSLSARDRARLLAYVPQTPAIAEGFSVFDYVMLGRNAYISAFGIETSFDKKIISDVIERLELTHIANRQLSTLSGGERQRAVLARGLAQEPRLLLLDEPTTSLDIGHQQDVMELVDSLRREKELTVVSTMHDLTLAGQYSDQLILMDSGVQVAAGTAEEVLTVELINTHFDAKVEVKNIDGRVSVNPLR